MTKYTYDDVVRVRAGLANVLRPGVKAWIIAVFADKASRPVLPFDNSLEGASYTVEFEDGSVAEVHESWLERFPEETDARVSLGDEYDPNVREAVVDVLKELGASQVDRSWGVGGSQELEVLKVSLGGATLVVEAETYMGLSIRGEKATCEKVAALVQKRLVRSKSK